MIKKAIILLVIVHVFSIIQSCCTTEFEIAWNNFSIDILDNSGEYAVIDTTNEVNKKALGFRIALLDTSLYYHMASNFSFINTCNATSCASIFISSNKITSLKITDLCDYSNIYPKNSDITTFFKARISSNERGFYSPINSVITYMNKASLYENENKFDLYLIDTTANIGNHKFEIEIQMSDGLVLKQTTDTLKLY